MLGKYGLYSSLIEWDTEGVYFVRSGSNNESFVKQKWFQVELIMYYDFDVQLILTRWSV